MSFLRPLSYPPVNWVCAIVISVIVSTHQTGGPCYPQLPHSLHSLAWAVWRRWSPARQSRAWAALWSQGKCHQSHQSPSGPEDRDINIHVRYNIISLTWSPPIINAAQPWVPLPWFRLGMSLTQPSLSYLETIFLVWAPPVMTTSSPSEIVQAYLLYILVYKVYVIQKVAL